MLKKDYEWDHRVFSGTQSILEITYARTDTPIQESELVDLMDQAMDGEQTHGISLKFSIVQKDRPYSTLYGFVMAVGDSTPKIYGDEEFIRGAHKCLENGKRIGHK